MHESMAQRARAELLERLRTRRLFESSEKARAAYASADSFAHKKFGLDPYSAAERAYAGIVRELIPGICGGDVKARAATIEIVGIESDSMGQTHTEEFADGSALIRLSDSMASGCGQIYDLLAFAARPYGKKLGRAARAWTRTNGDTDADSRSVALGAGALRYESIHQRLWARSAKLATTGDLWSKFGDALTGKRTQIALIFIIAHEMAHVLLGHTKSKLDAANDGRRIPADRLHAWELEADEWALRCVESMPFIASVRSGGPVEGATVALLAIHMNSDPLFIRAPESHPNTADRIRRLWDITTCSRIVAQPLLGVVFDMVANAGSPDTPLASEWWESLFTAPEFNTTWHSREYFTMIRVLDESAGWSTDLTHANIERLPRVATGGTTVSMAAVDFGRVDAAFDALDTHDRPSAVLTALGVYAINELIDPESPLSVVGLVDSLLESAAFEEAVSVAEENGMDVTPFRTMCYWISHHVGRDLRRPA